MTGGFIRQWRSRLTGLAGTSTVVSLRGHAATAIGYGTEGFPPDTRRRLRIMNVVAYLVGLVTLSYVVQHLFVDAALWRSVIVINALLAATAFAVPLLHRFGDVVGGLTLAIAEMIGMFAITTHLGRNSGVQIQYIVLAAAPFVILGLERMRLVVMIVLAATALHLAAWFWLPGDARILAAAGPIIDAVYVSAAVGTFLLVAVTVWYAFHLTEQAKAETESLLHNILPASIVERLKAEPDASIADEFDTASVLFADLKGFVSTAKVLGPHDTVVLLNELMRAFDHVADAHGIEKIKTIGDAYMAVSGLPERRADCALALTRAAVGLLEATQRVARARGVPLMMRVGIATGPVMAGVIGARRLTYDVWGDTVNLASRLEGLAEPGTIHVCPTTAARIGNALSLTSRGPTEIRGFGIEATWVVRPELAPPNETR